MTVRHLLVSAAMTASIAATDLHAQQGSDPRLALRPVAQDAMKPLLWMVGEWEGPATFTAPTGQSITLTQRETVISGAFNTVLLVQGRGTMMRGGTEQLVYNAAGALMYDPTKKQFYFSGGGGSGLVGMFEGTVNGTSFSWGYSAGNGERAKFDVTLTADGKWKELGYISHDDGKTWKQNIEMLLTRKP